MKRLWSYRRHDAFYTGVFLAPWLVTLAVFWLYPLGYALYLSFTKYYTLKNVAVFIGLDNYLHIVSDGFFWQALQNTMLFAAGTIPCTTILALMLAISLHSVPRFRSVFRVLFFLPSVTSLIVLALIFSTLYASNGYITALCQLMHLPFPARGWLQEPMTALPAIMVMDVIIASGYYTMLFLAGLQAIPQDLYEIADLAGVSVFQRLWYVTLPMIRPTLVFVLVVNTIRAVQIFVEIYIMTRGGPLGSTTTLMYSVYVNAFEKTDMMGYACALAYLAFGIVLVFAVLQINLMRTEGSSRR
ncbi:MAG: sugar ABC transporter permease [Bacteroidota bacterium]|nr:sugar ABC transporter permease [Candidatus Kapabacteria bacterium]MDW8219545.1 sugar ABC transporter permease [Bacteroidota bacterium]